MPAKCVLCDEYTAVCKCIRPYNPKVAYKFKPGDQVRRSRRWWPKDTAVYTVLAIDPNAKNNNDQPRKGYLINDPQRYFKNGVPYLEEELEPAAL